MFGGKKDWSDETFVGEVFNTVQMKRIHRSAWKQHMISFLNYSYSDDIRQSISPSSLLALILMLPHPTKSQLLFQDYFDKNRYDLDLPENGETLKILNKGHSSNRIFFSYIQNILGKNTPTDQNLTTTRVILGMMALVYLRCAVKSANSVISFMSKNLKNIMQSLYPNIKCPGEMPLPSNKFLENLQFTCNKNNSDIQEMLRFLVGIYTIEMNKKGSQADNALIQILNISLLHEIRLHGLGIISLLEKISSIYKISILGIIELVYPPPADQVKDPKIKELITLAAKVFPRMTVNEFYSKYMAKESKEISWPWSRLINFQYFNEFSIRVGLKSRELVAIVSLTEPGIWKMASLKNYTAYARTMAMEYAHSFDKGIREAKASLARRVQDN